MPLTSIRLAEVIGRITDAVVIVENRSAVGIQSLDFEITVGVVVAVRLAVARIAQPPRAAVCGPPRPLLKHAALHGIPRASAAPVPGTSHINNQARLSRVVVQALAHSVVHQSPVGLGARRPNLVAGRTGMAVSASPHLQAVVDANQCAGRVIGQRVRPHVTVGRAARCTLH